MRVIKKEFEDIGFESFKTDYSKVIPIEVPSDDDFRYRYEDDRGFSYQIEYYHREKGCMKNAAVISINYDFKKKKSFVNHIVSFRGVINDIEELKLILKSISYGEFKTK